MKENRCPWCEARKGRPNSGRARGAEKAGGSFWRTKKLYEESLGRRDGLGQKQVGIRGTGHARDGGQGSRRENNWDIGTVC